MSHLAATFDAHKVARLGRSGRRAVAIGGEVIGGSATGIDCIMVFVARKQAVDAGHHVPAETAGLPTDVVEMSFDFKPATTEPAAPDGLPKIVLSTDPFTRSAPLICGISVTSRNSPKDWVVGPFEISAAMKFKSVETRFRFDSAARQTACIVV